jgi:tmRNA-binding protein
LIPSEPSFVFINKKFLSLYYNITCKLTKQEVQNIFTANFKENAPLLLKKSEIKSFLEKNKRVFPKEIMLSIDY